MQIPDADTAYHEAAIRLISDVRRMTNDRLKKVALQSHMLALIGNQHADIIADVVMMELSNRVSAIELSAFIEGLLSYSNTHGVHNHK